MKAGMAEARDGEMDDIMEEGEDELEDEDISENSDNNMDSNQCDDKQCDGSQNKKQQDENTSVSKDRSDINSKDKEDDVTWELTLWPNGFVRLKKNIYLFPFYENMSQTVMYSQRKNTLQV